jgi:hypothetical protein
VTPAREQNNLQTISSYMVNLGISFDINQVLTSIYQGFLKRGTQKLVQIPDWDGWTHPIKPAIDKTLL